MLSGSNTEQNQDLKAYTDSEHYPRTIYQKINKVKDVNISPSGDWTEFTYCHEIDKCFLLKFLIDSEKVYLKPVRPYFNFEFEHMFGFGFQCSGYDKNKIVEVTSPTNYYMNFEKKLNKN